MALRQVCIKRSSAASSAATQADGKEQGRQGAATGLGALLKHGISLPPERAAFLKEEMEKGVAFYEQINESRLELALDYFDREMIYGLFEIIYLLHANSPALADWKYRVQYKEDDRTPQRKKDIVEKADLYIEGAPHGVQGFHNLPMAFREEFMAYTKSVFGSVGAPVSGEGDAPVVSIHSVGSTGTVGHKSGSSDLDLQVVYSLEPFSYDTPHLGDDHLIECCGYRRI